MATTKKKNKTASKTASTQTTVGMGNLREVDRQPVAVAPAAVTVPSTNVAPVAQPVTLVAAPPAASAAPAAPAVNAQAQLLPEGHPDTQKPAWLQAAEKQSQQKNVASTLDILNMFSKQPDVMQSYAQAMKVLQPLLEQQRLQAQKDYQATQDALTEWLSQRGILDSGVTIEQLTDAEKEYLNRLAWLEASAQAQALDYANQWGQQQFNQQATLANLALQQQQMNMANQQWQTEMDVSQNRWQAEFDQGQIDNAANLFLTMGEMTGYYPTSVPSVLVGTPYEQVLRSVAGQPTTAERQAQITNALNQQKWQYQVTQEQQSLQGFVDAVSGTDAFRSFLAERGLLDRWQSMPLAQRAAIAEQFTSIPTTSGSVADTDRLITTWRSMIEIASDPMKWNQMSTERQNQINDVIDRIGATLGFIDSGAGSVAANSQMAAQTAEAVRRLRQAGYSDAQIRNQLAARDVPADIINSVLGR